MSDATLYDQPDLYDLVMTPDASAEAFYIEEARKRGGAVLDLACGSGRFSIPLARAGLEVVGGDQSHRMLERARTKALAAGVRVALLPMDMREFDIPGCRFGLIAITANSLMHLHDADEIRRCLQAVVRHLAPGGALAFDVFVPSSHILARDPTRRHAVGRFTHDRAKATSTAARSRGRAVVRSAFASR